MTRGFGSAEPDDVAFEPDSEVLLLVLSFNRALWRSLRSRRFLSFLRLILSVYSAGANIMSRFGSPKAESGSSRSAGVLLSVSFLVLPLDNQLKAPELLACL